MFRLLQDYETVTSSAFTATGGTTPERFAQRGATGGAAPSDAALDSAALLLLLLIQSLLVPILPVIHIYAHLAGDG